MSTFTEVLDNDCQIVWWHDLYSFAIAILVYRGKPVAAKRFYCGLRGFRLKSDKLDSGTSDVIDHWFNGWPEDLISSVSAECIQSVLSNATMPTQSPILGLDKKGITK